MSDEIMKFFGCFDRSQPEAIKEREIHNRFYIMRNNIELKFEWLDNVLNNIKSVIKELNETEI